MAGGFSSDSLDQAQAADVAAQDAYAPQQAAPVMSADDYYRTMVQPTQGSIDLAYQQALGRTPEQAGRDYWAGKARELGWSGQELAQNINSAAAAERGQTGYQGQVNPQSFGQGPVGTAPSYYNTNPYTVDFQNIFNPRAGQVVRANPAMTPAQQAQYMTGWQQDYQSGVQRGLDKTKADRIAKADAAMQTYQTEKAKADAAAASKEAIDKAVREAIAEQGYGGSSNSNNIIPIGKAGGLASIKGFKK